MADKRAALRTLAVVATLAAGAALFVSASYEFSRERIAENERRRLMDSLSSVLSEAAAARDPVEIRLQDTDDALLGSSDAVDIFVMLDEGMPVATVIASVAPDGYNAPIQLLVGLGNDGTVTGVRVVSHRETPGLGDLIERGKSDWIEQFDGTSLGNPAVGQWTVEPEGGAFDSLTGATVTPRAVVHAVHNTLRYFEQNRDRLFAEASQAAAAAREPEEQVQTDE